MTSEVQSDYLTTPNESDREAFLAMHPNKNLMGCNFIFAAILWIPIAGALHEFTHSWTTSLVALILPIAWIIYSWRKAKSTHAQILKRLDEWQVRVIEGTVGDYSLTNRNLQRYPTKGSHSIQIGEIEFYAKPEHLHLLRYGAVVRVRMFHAYNLCHTIEILGYNGHDLNWTAQSEEPVIETLPKLDPKWEKTQRPYSRGMMITFTLLFGCLAALLYGIWGWNPGHWVILGFWVLTMWVSFTAYQDRSTAKEASANDGPPFQKNDQKITGILGTRSIEWGSSAKYFWGIGNQLFELQEADFVCAEPGDLVEIRISRRSPWVAPKRLRRYLDIDFEHTDQ